jgi:hypothetical protein
VYPSVVTPFNPAFMPGEIVAIGAGGSLTLRFDEPVTDDGANPHGLDVIVFGNTFFADRTYPSGVVDGVFGPFADSVVEVSADGIDWRTLTGGSLNGFFPTLGYSDLADPYALAAGAIESDFTRPVNPAFDPMGLSFSQVVAAYAGSGGGTGLDIASSGLAAVSFIRISVTSGELLIDGVSDVAAVPSLRSAAAAERSRCATSLDTPASTRGARSPAPRAWWRRGWSPRRPWGSPTRRHVRRRRSRRRGRTRVVARRVGRWWTHHRHR